MRDNVVDIVRICWPNESVSFEEACDIVRESGENLPESPEEWYNFTQMDFQRCSCCERAWYGERENIVHDDWVVEVYGGRGYDYLCIECQKSLESGDVHEPYYFDEKEFLPIGSFKYA